MWLSLGVKNALLGRVGVVAGVFEEKCLGVNGGAKSASTWLALVSLGWVGGWVGGWAGGWTGGREGGRV